MEKTKLSDLRGSVVRTLSHLTLPVQPDDPPPSSSVPRGECDLLSLSSTLGKLEERMEMLAEAPAAIEDALAELLTHTDRTLQQRAVETYIRRLYQVGRRRGWGWGWGKGDEG